MGWSSEYALRKGTCLASLDRPGRRSGSCYSDLGLARWQGCPLSARDRWVLLYAIVKIRKKEMAGVSRRGYIPLIQRPTKRAPRSSLPRSGSKPGIGFRFKNVWNSGTSWKSQRKARKLPSSAQGGRVTASPSRPRSIIP